MEMIVISSTRLKVMLSAEDMEKYRFDPEDCADISTRSAFRTILLEARDRCGFDAVGDRVFVQYYPSRAGGGEMFVTKLSDCAEYSGTETMRNEEIRQRGGGDGSEKNGKYKTGYIIYMYENLGEVLLSCAALKTKGYCGESRAYSMESAESVCSSQGGRMPSRDAASGCSSRCGSGYFLVLDRDSFLPGEYGGSLCDPRYYHVLEEHGRLICADAAATLGGLA